MAKPNHKTRHAVGGRAEGESAVAVSQAAGGNQDLKQDSSADITRVDAAKTSEADSDWDFSSGSTGMAKETKIGLALCVLLIGAFAFVVYSKMHKQNRLDGDIVAGSDTSGDNAPPSSNDAQHDDFGGEPAIDHGNAFASDRQSNADNFDVPPRRGRNRHNDFQQAADLKKDQQREHGANPWQSPQQKPFDDRSRSRQSAGHDDPFTQVSHRHEQQDEPQHQAAGEEPDFGFEDSKSNQSQPAEQSEKKESWELADFLDNRKHDETEQHQQQQLPAEDDDEPFGLEPVGTTQRETHQQQHQQDDEFNPFAETDTEHSDVSQHQSANRTIADAHQPSHVDSNDTPHSAETDGGSTTRVHRSDEFGHFDEPQHSGDATAQRERFSREEFGDLGPAREAGRDQQHDRIGQHDSPAHDDVSQPFANRDDHGEGDHLLRKTAAALVYVDSDRPAVYVARRGDNFWDISKKQYGAGRYYKALASYNQQRIPDPRRLRPGMKVLIPQTKTLEARFPSLCPWKTAKAVGGTIGSDNSPGFFTSTDGTPRYRVGAEDTLTAIAKNHLGRASRWVQVYALNRDRISDPAKLKIGTVLQLPADASRVQLVRRSRNFR